MDRRIASISRMSLRPSMRDLAITRMYHLYPGKEIDSGTLADMAKVYRVDAEKVIVVAAQVAARIANLKA